MKYLVTAAYKDVVDTPQVYETEVDADTAEDAEVVAQVACYRDNHGEPDARVTPDDYMLTDVFARPVAQHTPNGYDTRWVEAINGVLQDREEDARIHDIDPVLWDRFIAPMVDAITDDFEATKARA